MRLSVTITESTMGIGNRGRLPDRFAHAAEPQHQRLLGLIDDEQRRQAVTTRPTSTMRINSEAGSFVLHYRAATAGAGLPRSTER